LYGKGRGEGVERGGEKANDELRPERGPKKDWVKSQKRTSFTRQVYKGENGEQRRYREKQGKGKFRETWI